MKFTLVLIGCFACLACSGDPSDQQPPEVTGPQAELTVSFDSGGPVTLTTTGQVDSTTSRLLLRVSQNDVTILLSIAKPVTSTTTTLTGTGQELVVWAKQGNESPRVADSGQVNVSIETGVITVTDVLKHPDTLGGSMSLSGTLAGVPFQ